MKRFKNTVFLLIAMIQTGLIAADILDSIASAISSGNAAAVAAYFDANVDITIDDKESMYSKSQAQSVVQGFFAKNPVRSFSINHRGSSAGGKQFGIGTLVTSNGQYRVYYLVMQKNNTSLIQEMRFEKQR